MARQPKFVRLHPEDIGVGLMDPFWDDPKTFTRIKTPAGHIRLWGLYPHDDIGHIDIDPMVYMQRRMTTQHWYLDAMKSPGHQFVAELIRIKQASLKARNISPLLGSDIVLKVYLTWINDSVGKPRVWRRIRVSAGMRLSTFQDKVLAPVMGWTRNMHCYVFQDLKDGATFGPRLNHMNLTGIEYIPDHNYAIAHLIEKVGDVFEYFYDFGDKFIHFIEVEHIVPQEQPNGQVVILDGAGMCPGENMNGNIWFGRKHLPAPDHGSKAAKLAKVREILTSPNYEDYSKPASEFNFDVFHAELAERRLADALASKASERSGARSFTTQFPGFDTSSQDQKLPWKRNEQKVRE
ncbi:hypothetical protein DL93DRAFT_2173943 [Clavulina sp. PMI_390]|nr:hypothetical protein DL93DRAFT_2173943 [Clavulina sp. PMI_390]